MEQIWWEFLFSIKNFTFICLIFFDFCMFKKTTIFLHAILVFKKISYMLFFYFYVIASRDFICTLCLGYEKWTTREGDPILKNQCPSDVDLQAITYTRLSTSVLTIRSTKYCIYDLSRVLQFYSYSGRLFLEVCAV